jgi:thiamine biosynthesis lipoprotein
MRRAVYLGFASVLAAACWCAPARAAWETRVTDGIMGTRITVEVWTDTAAKADQANEAVLAAMRHIDATMSTYKPSSEVSQVNARAADGPMPISKELFDLLVTAKEYSRLTEGAFDITYASVGYLYDFRKRIHPDEAHIRAALPAVNYEHVLLDAEHQTVQFSQKGVRIDLGGIAKGYAVDCGIEAMRKAGITHGYVAAGGDSRMIGDQRRGIGHRARAAHRCGDVDIGRLRALFRRGWRPLSPHHRPAYRPFGEQGAQRDRNRPHRDTHRWPVENRLCARAGAGDGNL